MLQVTDALAAGEALPPSMPNLRLLEERWRLAPP
jgi:hypothetical protein